jgi:integrase/recombinase XerD
VNKHPLEGLSMQYLSEKNVSISTVKSYGFAFKHFIQYLKENQIEFAKTSDVIRYRESKRALGYSTHWIYIQICALRGLYHFLRYNQKRFSLPVEYEYDIMTSIKNERIKPVINKPILSIEQARHLILHTKNIRKSFWHYRDHAIVYLMLTSGVRSVEILRAKRSDYRLVEEKWLLYFPSIGRALNAEFVKLSKGASEAMNDYLRRRNDDNPYLFITHKHGITTNPLSSTFFKRMFRSVLKSCGLEDSGITPHCLRHTAAMMNLLRGGSVESTRQLLRHVEIESTLVYVHHIERMNDDSERLIEAFILKETESRFKDEFFAFFEDQ